jgi:cytochrome c-type biogenesis protein CcmH/NrfG
VTDTSGGGGTKPADSQDSGFKLYLAGGVAIVAVLAYGVFVLVMWGQIGVAEQPWTRGMLLLTGVEAITFAAVGWIFGREVNRGKAESADQAQKDAQQKAREAGEADGKGLALADAIRAEASGPSLLEENASLVGLANRLFPPR